MTRKTRFDRDMLKIGSILLLFLMGYGGLWVMNDVTGCLYMTSQLGVKDSWNWCGVTNGFFFINGARAFHIGLYSAELSLFMLTLILLYLIFKQK